MRLWSRLLIGGAVSCLLAAAVTIGAPAASLATGTADDNDAGRLDLNANVLVNETVGSGAAGDFAIRGRLFLEGLSARALEQREASAERLRVAGTLTFEPSAAVDEYQGVRGALFDGYSSTVISETREARKESPILALLALVVGLPLVLLGGVLLGRFWARRRRVSA